MSEYMHDCCLIILLQLWILEMLCIVLIFLSAILSLTIIYGFFMLECMLIINCKFVYFIK